MNKIQSMCSHPRNCSGVVKNIRPIHLPQVCQVPALLHLVE
jgi:hypothetical protein